MRSCLIETRSRDYHQLCLLFFLQVKKNLRCARRTHGSSVGGGQGDSADSAFHLSLSISISTSISLSLALALWLPPPHLVSPEPSTLTANRLPWLPKTGRAKRTLTQAKESDSFHPHMILRSELSLSRTRLSLDASVDRMSVLHDRRVQDRHRRSNLLCHLKPFRPKHPDLQS